MSEVLQPTLRGPVESDWNYIRGTWKNSYRSAERFVPPGVYWPQQSSEIERYISRAHFRVACDPEDSDFIWGWACIDGNTLHYVHVRESSREQGLAKMLTHALPHPIPCTHWTEYAERIALKHPGLLLFSPSRRVRHLFRDREERSCVSP